MFTFGVTLLQEKVLELEYMKAVAPTKHEDHTPHDEWVSTIDAYEPIAYKF
jgi:hypothetical protein